MLLQRQVGVQSILNTSATPGLQSILNTSATPGLTVRSVAISQPSTTVVLAQTATASTVNPPGLTLPATSSLPALATITTTTNTTVSTTQVVSAVTPVVSVTTSAVQPLHTLVSTQPVLTSTAATTGQQVLNATSVQQTLSITQSPSKSITQSPTKTTTAKMPPLQVVRTVASQLVTPSATAATSSTAVSAATSSGKATPATVTSASVPKTTPSTQAPGGKITISAATAQMLAQKGIVLTRTPQGTFVAKIPQSMLLKAAAQGQIPQPGGKPGVAGGLSLLSKLQTAGAQAAQAQSAAQASPGVKSPTKAKAQPTILSKTKKTVKSPTQVIAASSASTGAATPKFVYTIGGQQIPAPVPAGAAATTEQKPKMILTLKPGVSAAEEVKKIGMELGKLQGQSKTPENLQKLKDLHAKLKQLQLTVQASAAVVAKAKVSHFKVFCSFSFLVFFFFVLVAYRKEKDITGITGCSFPPINGPQSKIYRKHVFVCS